MLTPPPVRRLLHRCLEKNPKQRLRDIGDARLELDDSSGSSETSGMTAPPSGRHINLAWTAAGLTAVAVIAGVLGWTLKPAVTPAVSRLSHVLPVDVRFGFGPPGSVVTVAPDGSSLVYASINALYRRALSERDAVPIRGTEGSPRVPFFSPDGLSLGYWDSAAGELRRIALDGGTPVSLTRATAPYGASWETEDTILYGQANGIWRVSAKGGAPEQLVRIDTTELAYGPRLLPDGRSLIFSIVTRESMIGITSAWDSARIVAQSLETGARTEIRRGSDARVLPTGHLIYAQGSALFAVAFDSATRDVSGAPVPIAEGILRAGRGQGGQGGSANYDISRNGTLVYAQRPGYWDRPTPRRLLSVDLAGNARPLIDDQREYWRPRIAPDGTRVAVEVLQPDGESHVWTVDLQRGTASPLFTERRGGYVSWTPDSESVIWTGQGAVNLYRQPADGSGAPQALLEDPGPALAMDVSRDGVVAFAGGITESDIRMLDLASGTVSAYLATPAREYMARFSPDGRWLAYTSNESGRNEVYVRPFPRTDGVARLVSVDGGLDPVWAPNGETLYYRGASGYIMAVPVTPGATFMPGRPKPLFRFAGIYRISGTGTAYDIHPDGQRFIMVSEADEQSADSSPQQVHVVLNWFEELKRRATR
jgi:serine/threonine-protein kinase